jgi:protein-disulfide isomerase
MPGSLTGRTKLLLALAIVSVAMVIASEPRRPPRSTLPALGDLYQRYVTGLSEGPDGAPVILLVYSDYRCGFCRQFFGTLRQLRQKYPQHVTVIWKNIAVDRGDGAIRTLMAAHCAAAMGSFRAFHQAAFANSAVVSYVDGWRTIAERARLGATDSLGQCVKSLSYRQRVDEDMAEAGAAGPLRTPTWYLNGRPGVGAASLETLDSLVGMALRPTDR